MEFECELCNAVYQPKMITQRFCSPKCAKEFRRLETIRFCITCGDKINGTGIKYCNVCKDINRITLNKRFDILNRDGFRCVYCGRNPKDDGVKLQVDHIIPRSKGGTNEVDNLSTSCEDCNLGKSDTRVVP